MTETASPSAAPDVGALLDELRAQVRARRLHLAQPEDDALARDLQRALDEIELHRVVSAHWPLIGRTLPERAMALINKLVRRYLRWYINPIVEQQNAYNDAVARTLRLLAEAYADLANQGSAVSGQRSGDEGQPTSPALQRRETGSGDEGQPTSPALQRRETGPIDIKDIQYVVRERAAAEPPARFPDLELRAQEQPLGLRQRVSAHWPLPAHSLQERGVALLNKSVRQYLRWYINPVVEQQNSANQTISVALRTFIRLDAQRRAERAVKRHANMNSEF